MRQGNQTTMTARRAEEKSFPTYHHGDSDISLGWQIAIVVPVIGIVCIVGVIVYLLHKRIKFSRNTNPASIYQTDLSSNMMQGTCIDDINIDINHNGIVGTENNGYLHRTAAPLMAREPVSIDSVLFNTSMLKSPRCVSHNNKPLSGSITKPIDQNMQIQDEVWRDCSENKAVVVNDRVNDLMPIDRVQTNPVSVILGGSIQHPKYADAISQGLDQIFDVSSLSPID